MRPAFQSFIVQSSLPLGERKGRRERDLFKECILVAVVKVSKRAVNRAYRQGPRGSIAANPKELGAQSAVDIRYNELVSSLKKVLDKSITFCVIKEILKLHFRCGTGQVGSRGNLAQ